MAHSNLGAMQPVWGNCPRFAHASRGGREPVGIRDRMRDIHQTSLEASGAGKQPR